MTGTKTYGSTGSSSEAFSIPGYARLNPDSDFALSDYKTLASGGFGCIKEGELLNPFLVRRFARGGDKRVAIKLYFEGADVLAFRYEVAITATICRHPNLLEFIGYTEEPCCSLVMRMYRGSLKGLLEDPKAGLSNTELLHLVLDIAVGMQEVHRCGVVHLDLKPANVLIDDYVDGSKMDGLKDGQNQRPRFRAVIADFGCATIIGLNTGTASVAKGLRSPLEAGMTPAYAAPELFARLRVIRQSCTADDRAIDVYAWAITAFETLGNRRAWPDYTADQIVRAVTDGQRPVFDEAYPPYPDSVKQLISRAWEQLPFARPDFAAIASGLRDVLRGELGEVQYSMRVGDTMPPLRLIADPTTTSIAPSITIK